ncbi:MULTISPECIES: GNAT family N-acetyltransferase [Acetobacter]|uniref:N-acetyltransferase n=1 Tax=Acetobacter tropicalis TaxID=104102 RepID=A0A291PG40_9PROT|nr:MULTISPECIES: GNAT family protein [Acetobacter]ATJ90452.1 hypothetical protein CIW82_06865 [Acetobacter tropicalis]
MFRVLTSVDDYPRITAFLSERLGVQFFPPYTCIASERHGKIECAILFNIYTGFDIHVTIAGNKFSRGLLREFGWYLFRQLEVERFTAITEKQNVVRLVERLGGKREGVIRNHFGPGRDAILMGVLRSEYRFHAHGFQPEGTKRHSDGANAV